MPNFRVFLFRALSFFLTRYVILRDVFGSAEKVYSEVDRIARYCFTTETNQPMDPSKLDLAKFVGAASAPVALIISTSIFLSNLTAKYIPAFSRLRSMTEEMRNDPEHPDRVESLHEQIELYRLRIKWLLRAVFYLTLAIVCFINTVAFTSISMFFPG